MAGYITTQSKGNSYSLIPMPSTAGMKFDFPMAMGVRNGDTARKAQLDRLIAAKAPEIKAIIASYNIPLLAIEKPSKRDDDWWYCRAAIDSAAKTARVTRGRACFVQNYSNTCYNSRLIL